MGEDRRRPETRLIHPLRRSDTPFEAIPVPVHRASTVLFDTLADAFAKPDDERHYRYGVHGTPTTRELELRFAEIEGAAGCTLAPSGLAALALTYFATCKAGDHALLPDSAYFPNARIGDFLDRMGVDVDHYDPMIGAGIADRIRPETALIWCESPGSISMEVQDVPAIVKAAHEADVLVAVDNTYGAGLLYNPLDHGADLSVHALTKYPGGHADVLMGAINARTPEFAETVQETTRLLGLCVSADEASLVLRGLPTMRLRLDKVEADALELARWMDGLETVETVLHPALPSCPGHDFWQRDFTGSAGIFSVVFKGWSRDQVHRFVDALELFRIGYSWGGPTSLVMAYQGLKRPSPEQGERLVRFNIGLENVEDLRADIEQALAKA